MFVHKALIIIHCLLLFILLLMLSDRSLLALDMLIRMSVPPELNRLDSLIDSFVGLRFTVSRLRFLLRFLTFPRILLSDSAVF